MAVLFKRKQRGFSTFTDENHESTDVDEHTPKPDKPKHRLGGKTGVNV